MGKQILVIANLPESLVRFRLPLLVKMRAAGHTVHCAAPALSERADVVATLRGQGIETHDVPLARTGTNPIADARTFGSLLRLCGRLRPDHVLAYTVKPVVYGTLAASLCGVPHRTVLMTGLGYAFTGEANGRRGLVQRLLRGLLRRALAKATAILFQNRDDAALLGSMNLLPAGVPVTIVDGSGVDLDLYPPQPLPPGPPVFLLVARLLSAKGIREYAAAAALLKREHPDARFVLIGPHDSNPDALADAEIAAFEAGGAIEWLGPVEDVRPHLADCHVYVLPSYREGTPRSTLEAMATGRAVVTTDAPGCRETVVEGVNGHLVPVGDAAALADAMRRLIDDPAQVASMGEQSLRIARERYDVHRVNAAMVAAMGLAA